MEKLYTRFITLTLSVIYAAEKADVDERQTHFVIPIVEI